MSRRQVNIDRNTPLLMPPDLREWVSGDDLVHFLVDVLPLVDVSCAVVNHRGTGSEQYPPGMMLGLLVYCYANGIFSSRRMERATYQNVSVRYLCADTHPDHDTIAKFRRENGALLRQAFVEVLQLAARSGLLKLGTLVLDGTKLEASASKRKTLTAAQLDEELQRLDRRVAELMECAEQAEQQPQEQEALPEALADAQQRRARLLAAREELDAQVRVRHEQREKERQERPPGDKPRPLSPTPLKTDTLNPTDPQSTLTPTATVPYIQGYNAQAVISGQKRGLIVAADVVRDTSDMRQLEPMIRQAVANTGHNPRAVLVDKGYDNLRQIVALEKDIGCQVFCPPVAIANEQEGFAGRGNWRTFSKARRKERRERMQTPQAKKLYSLRGVTIEPAFGTIKGPMGFRRFLLRGLKKVKLEWCLVTLAFNCRRMAAAGI